MTSLFSILIIIGSISVWSTSGAPKSSPNSRKQQNADRELDIASRLVVPNGAFCDKRVPAYLVLDNYRLKSSIALPFKNVSEVVCAQMCSDNKDKKDKALLCSSFSYDKSERTCIIHRQKAKPAGESDLMSDEMFRYYEKFCLPTYAPLDCGEALFFRGQEAVLEGSALNVSKAEQLSECIEICIKAGDKCLSAMYFQEVGECIVNGASAQDRPERFLEERKDKVIYFENGCILGNQVRKQAKFGTEAPTTVDEDASTAGAENVDKEEESVIVDEEHKEVEEETPALGEWGQWNPCDRPDGRRMRKRICTGSKKACKNKVVETQWCQDIETTTEKPSSTTTEADDEATTSRDENSDDAKSDKKEEKNSSKSPVKKEDEDEADAKVSPFFGKLAQVDEKSSGGGMWGPWAKNCQQFSDSQPCVDGSTVGFQDRQCLRSPFECEGPFFRYCFIPCRNQQNRNNFGAGFKL